MHLTKFEDKTERYILIVYSPVSKKNKKTLVSTSTCIHVHTKKGRRGRERWGEKDKQSNPLQSMARSYWPHPYSPWTLHTHWSHLQVGIFQSDEKQREHLYCVGGGGGGHLCTAFDRHPACITRFYTFWPVSKLRALQCMDLSWTQLRQIVWALYESCIRDV